MTENRGTNTTTPTFAAYLQRELDKHDWSGADLARQADVPQSSVSRWLKEGRLPTIDNARQLAEKLGRPLLEVLVAAGIVKPDEVGQDIELRADPATLSDDELLAELRRRMKSAVPRPPTREEREAEPGRFGTAGDDRKRRRRSRG